MVLVKLVVSGPIITLQIKFQFDPLKNAAQIFRQLPQNAQKRVVFARLVSVVKSYV